MKKFIATLALMLAFAPAVYAQETVGDKAHEVKTDAVQAKRSAGAEIREAGREIKQSAREVRQAVVTRCGDGRHTVKGASGCDGHGGVVDPK